MIYRRIALLLVALTVAVNAAIVGRADANPDEATHGLEQPSATHSSPSGTVEHGVKPTHYWPDYCYHAEDPQASDGSEDDTGPMGNLDCLLFPEIHEHLAGHEKKEGEEEHELNIDYELDRWRTTIEKGAAVSNSKGLPMFLPIAILLLHTVHTIRM